jgi:hypothetical protein
MSGEPTLPEASAMAMRSHLSPMKKTLLKMLPIRHLAAALSMMVLLLPGCGRDNGMPGDLTELLKAHDILVQPSRSHAPHSQRGGFLVAKHDSEVAAKIISTFGLKKIPADDPAWSLRAPAVGAPVAAKEVWGVSGRPAQLKLKDGAQFEYFYLLVTPDGEMYLMAEYAYG